MQSAALEDAVRAAGRAADRARREILPRFRNVGVEWKHDGSPVTEADREAERVIREVLREATPDFGVIGEELGSDEKPERPYWVVDPIDGTIAFSRGIPLFSTLIALVEDDKPVLGLIDLPALGERYLGWRGSGCHRNGATVRVSQESELSRALVSHGDPFTFELAGESAAFERMAKEIPMLRGYTDAFGHAQVICGGVDAMVDCDCNLWDVCATELLVAEAQGACVTRRRPGGKHDLVIGSPALVEQLAGFLTADT